MVVNHMCGDTCLTHRVTTKQHLICFYCENSFNAKCFNITSMPLLKQITPDSNLFFLCIKCHTKINRMKSKEKEEEGNKRNSVNKRSSAPSLDGELGPSTHITSEKNTYSLQTIETSDRKMCNVTIWLFAYR